MIASPCSTCVFFDKEKIKCEHFQFFISTPKSAYSPGFCRLWRSQKWSDNRNTTRDNLVQLSRNEAKLTYDLLIIHNSDDHLDTLENHLMYNLCPALSSTNKFQNICNRIIIADVTRKSDRKQIMNLFKQHKGKKNLDILVTGHEEENPSQTIKRLSRTIKEKYFVVIPSSYILSSRDNEMMVNEINNKDTRFIYWPFKMKLAQTEILQLQPVWGLYIAGSYDKLTQLSEVPKTFYENLKQEEITTGIQLCCPVDVAI